MDIRRGKAHLTAALITMGDTTTHSVWAFGIEQAILGLLTKTESMTAKCLLVEARNSCLFCLWPTDPRQCAET